MKLIGVTYKNHEITDRGTFHQLPEDLKKFLEQVNGIICYKGGLHIRGCVSDPEWHSINYVWSGKQAFWKTYSDLLDIDIPFAQDCMGDQYLLRQNKVIKLMMETGELEELNLDFTGFLNEIEKDPVAFLGMHPLIQLELEGGKIEPGELVHAYPPFSLQGSLQGISSQVTLSSKPSLDQLAFLADFYKKSKLSGEQGFQFVVD